MIPPSSDDNGEGGGGVGVGAGSSHESYSGHAGVSQDMMEIEWLCGNGSERESAGGGNTYETLDTVGSECHADSSCGFPTTNSFTAAVGQNNYERHFPGQQVKSMISGTGATGTSVTVANTSLSKPAPALLPSLSISSIGDSSKLSPAGCCHAALRIQEMSPDISTDVNAKQDHAINNTNHGAVKLQPSIRIQSRQSDREQLRNRRRMWLEEQARQIDREERHHNDDGDLAGDRGPFHCPSAAADAAATTASTMLYSPLSNPGKSHDFFRNRSVSITGMVIASPSSDKFILNIPEGKVNFSGVTQGLAKMEEDSDIAYAIGDTTDEVYVDESLREDEGKFIDDGISSLEKIGADDDASAATVIVSGHEESAIDPISGQHGDASNALHTGNLAGFELGGHPPSDAIRQETSTIPAVLYRRRAESGRLLPDDHATSEDPVFPPRPQSSEPRIVDSLISGMDKTFAVFDTRGVVTAKKMTRVASASTRPLPPPPVNDIADRRKEYVSRSSRLPSRPRCMAKQHTLSNEELNQAENMEESEDSSKVEEMEVNPTAMLQFRRDPVPAIGLDKIPPPPLLALETQQSRIPHSIPIISDIEVDRARKISFADEEGVEVCLSHHTSSPGHGKVDSGRTLRKSVNVASLDRSASVADYFEEIAPCSRACGAQTDNALCTEDNIFTPPHVKSQISLEPPPRRDPLASQIESPMGIENEPPLKPAQMSFPPPNMSSVGRSASMGGQFLRSPESTNFRTPGRQSSTQQQRDIARKRPGKTMYSKPPSLPLSSPNEGTEGCGKRNFT